MIHAISTARNNAELVAQAASLYAPDPARQEWLVLDPTYGRGKMWDIWRPELLSVCTQDFTKPFLLPEPGYVDLVLFDPPYVAKGGKATKASVAEHDDRYGREARPDRKTALTVDEVHQLVTCGMTNCAAVLRPGGWLWVKSADYVTSGRKVWGNHDVRCHGRKLGLTQVDELYLRSKSPQPTVNLDGTPRRQAHSRTGFSMLSIWRRR